MTTITLEQTNLTLHQIADLVRAGPVVITADGKPIMAVVALNEDDEPDDLSLGQSTEVMALVTQARQQLREMGGFSLADMRRELGLQTN